MPPHTPQVEGARAPPGLEPLTGVAAGRNNPATSSRYLFRGYIHSHCRLGVVLRSGHRGQRYGPRCDHHHRCLVFAGEPSRPPIASGQELEPNFPSGAIRGIATTPPDAHARCRGDVLGALGLLEGARGMSNSLDSPMPTLAGRERYRWLSIARCEDTAVSQEPSRQ